MLFRRLLKLTFTQITVFLVSALSVICVHANPVLNNVAAGNAIVTQSGSNTVIQQNSQKAIINWHSFNIAKDEATRFNQPNTSSVALNRVDASQGASQIYGRLSSNGKIVIVNGAGVHFGASALVNVGSLIVSTSDISNDNFLKGNYIFDQPSPYAGSIVNEGTIIAAQNGLVALIGHDIQNNGLIQAEIGNIILASGNKFTLDFYGDQLINFSIDQAAQAGSVVNTTNGQLLADGGKILVTAKAAQGVLDNVISMDGVAQANSVSEKNGIIILDGGDNGNVALSGKLSASGSTIGSTGGTVKVLGNTVTLASTAFIDASGDAGGGNILVGGNIQGSGPEKNAFNTTVEAGAILKADAINKGNGGSVVVWSDNTTNFAGAISVMGGAVSGNGGFSEVSGHHNLIFAGSVILSAPHGTTGLLLLDPEDVTISSSTDTNNTNFDNNSSNNTYTPTSDSSNINYLTLESLLANANVTITTGSVGSQLGDITLDSSVHTLTWTSANTLTLTAANRIFLNANISAANGGLNLSAATTSQSITSGTESSPSSTGVTATINVNTFNLLQGNWYQANAVLPTFTATNFQINSGAANPSGVEFLRVVGGTGSVATPYELTDIYGLQGMGSSAALLQANYVLNNNIDATVTSGWNSGAGFVPVGPIGNAFTGSLDGQNYAISNLTINQPQSSGQVGIGLFGNIGASTLGITNLNLLNVYIMGGTTNASIDTNNTNIQGGIGALAGVSSNGAPISNVTVSGSVNALTGQSQNSAFVGGVLGEVYGGTLTNVANLSNVTFNSNGGGDVGGIVGDLEGATITHSYNTGTITSAVSGTGGIAGHSGAGSQVLLSFNAGTVTNPVAFQPGGFNEFGGIVGDNPFGLISQSYNTGSIIVDNTIAFTQNSFPVFVGGLTGQSGLSGSVIENSYNLGEVFVTYAAIQTGGIAGAAWNVITNVFNAGLVKSTFGTPGGLTGEVVGGGTITNSFWDTSTSGTSAANNSYALGASSASLVNVAGGCLSGSCSNGGTVNLSQQSTYTPSGTYTSGVNNNWDFTSVWGISNGASYPYLQGLTTNPRVITGTLGASGLNIGVVANGVNYTAQTGANNVFYFLIPGVANGSAINTYLPNGGGNVVLAASGTAIPAFSASDFTSNTLTIGNSTASTLSNSALISGLGYNNLSTVFYSGTGANLVIGNTTYPNINVITNAATTYNVDGTLSTVSGTSGIVFNGATHISGNITTAGSQIYNGVITLTSGANPILTTNSGDITLANNIIWDAAGNTLKLSANGNVDVNSPIASSINGANLYLRADNAGTGTGTIVFGNNADTINMTGTGLLHFYYNPTVFGTPTDFSAYVIGSNTFTPYMLINSLGAETDGVNDSRSLAALSNTSAIWGNNFALAVAIDASATSGWNSGAGFNPIGNNTTAFSGNFDGLSNSIYSLTINRPATSYVGLFGKTASATINNIGLSNAMVSGNQYTGGLIGYANAGAVSTAYVTGSVTGNGDNVGGLIGYINNTTVNLSYNLALVTGAGSNIGGFAGFSNGVLANDFSYGNVIASNNAAGLNVGGFVGNAAGSIATSYSIGYVTNANAGSTSVGSFIGLANNVTTTNDYWNTDTAGSYAGIGSVASGSASATGRTTAQLQAALPTGFDSQIWAFITDTSYPYLQTYVNSNPRVISGNVGQAGATMGVVINGTLIPIGGSGSNGAYYDFLPNVVDGTPLLVFGSGSGNLLATLPSGGASLTGLSLPGTNTIMSSGSSQLSNSFLNSLISNVSSNNILFSGSGSNLVIGNSASPVVNFIMNTPYLLNGNISSYSNAAGNFTFNDAVTLPGGTSPALTTTGNITFNSKINGADSLTLTSALNTLAQNVGDTQALTTLTLTGGSDVLGGTLVTTTGTQTYNDNLSLTAGTTFTSGSDIVFNGALGWAGSQAVSVHANNDIYFNGDITAPNGTLTLYASNGSQGGSTIGSGTSGSTPVSMSGAVNVAAFNLTRGQWYQNSASLPNFSAGLFNVSSGSNYNQQYNAEFTRLQNSGGIKYITDIYGLQGIGAADLGLSYQLANDIDASGTVNWNSGSGFTPIGNNSPYLYNGTFNGNGHTITGLYIYLPGHNYVGLFGALDSSAVIENLNIQNATISGSINTGGLAGYSRAALTQNVYVNAVVTGYFFYNVGGLYGQVDTGTITNAHTSGSVTVQSNFIASLGGLVGYASDFTGTTDINNSSSSSTIDSSSSTAGRAVGGLVGAVDSQSGSFLLSDSYATGRVMGSALSAGTGGLIGQNFNNVSNSYSTGYVTGGGLIGGMIGQNGGSVTNSYWDTQTSGQTYSAAGTGLTTAQLQSGLPTGFSSGTWGIIAGDGVNANGSYPYLLSQYATTPTVISGYAPGGSANATGLSGNAVQLVVNGAAVAASAASIGRVLTGDNGFYYFIQPTSAIPSAAPVLTYMASDSNLASAITMAPSNNVISGLNLTTNSVTVGDVNINSLTNGNTFLASAQGSISANDLLYHVTGSALTLNDGVDFTTTANTSYGIDGSIVAQSGNLNNVSFGNSVILNVDTTLNSNANITFSNTIDGAHSLTLNASAGSITFNGEVGVTTPLTALTATANAIAINTDQIKTVQAQSYTGAVTLNNANLLLTSTNQGGISFSNAVDGATALAVANNSGSIYFGNTVGASTVLTSLTAGLNDPVTLNNLVQTIGDQSYGGAITLGSDTTLLLTGSNSSISIAAGVTNSASRSLTLQTAASSTGTLTFQGNFNLANIYAIGGASSTTSLQTIGENATWNITGTNAGNLTNLSGSAVSGVFTFTNMTNLGGGVDSHHFVFANGGSITGNVSGGAGGSNVVDFSNYATETDVTLTGSNNNGFTGSIANLIGGNFSQITSVTGSTATSAANTLNGENTINTWAITGSDSGTYHDNIYTLAFSHFGNLNGGTNDNTFTVSNGGLMSGTLTGSVSGNNRLDFSADTSASNVVLNGSAATGFSGTSNLVSAFNNITQLVGSSTAVSQLSGENSNSTWSITGNDSGTYQDASVNSPLIFSHFGSLSGGSANNTFIFTNGKTLSGSIDGGSNGAGMLDFSNYTTAVAIALSGSTASGFSGTMTGLLPSFSEVAQIQGGSAANTITGANTANTWTLTGVNAGTVNDSSHTFTFNAFANITGGSSTDNLVLNGGTLTGVFNGGSGVNSITADNVVNTWNINGSNAGTVTGLGSFTHIQNLTGGNTTNNFVFANNSSISGQVDGGNTTAINTLNYAAYLNPVTITLNTNTSGYTQNNSGVTITQFQNINNFTTPINSRLNIANTSKTNTIYITGGGTGYLNDPTNFVGITNYSAAANAITNIIFSANASYSVSAATAVVNGITMRFYNIASISGNLTFSDPVSIVAAPVVSASPAPVVVGNNVTNIITSATVMPTTSYVPAVTSASVNTSSSSSGSTSSDGSTSSNTGSTSDSSSSGSTTSDASTSDSSTSTSSDTTSNSNSSSSNNQSIACSPAEAAIAQSVQVSTTVNTSVNNIAASQKSADVQSPTVSTGGGCQ